MDSTTKVCEVPGYNLEAEYDSPDDWCKRHWNTWWNWSEEKREPKWMSNPKNREKQDA